MRELLRSFKIGKCTRGFAAAAVVASVIAFLLTSESYFVTTPVIIGALIAVLNALAWEFFVILFLKGSVRDQTQTPLVDRNDPFAGTEANKTAAVQAEVSGLRIFFMLKFICLALALGGMLLYAIPQAAEIRSSWAISMLFGYALTLLLGCLAIALSHGSRS